MSANQLTAAEPTWPPDRQRPKGRPMRPERSNRLRDAALRTAARGWPVFPLWARTKRPVIKAWERGATTDPERIARWWRDAPYNVGMACGRANLVVIDLDRGHGDPPPEEFAGAGGGADVLEILAARAGQPAPWDTFTVASPSGGLHLYFTAPPGLVLRNTAGAAGRGLGWCIDSRSHGGYIVAAGSRRPEGLYREVNDHPVAELPQWLARALAREPAAEAESRRGSGITVPRQCDVNAYVRAIVQDETDLVRAAATGTRNDVLNRAAWTLGRLVAGGELDEAYARVELEAAAAVHIGVERFSATEARQTVASGLAAGQRLPRRIERSD